MMTLCAKKFDRTSPIIKSIYYNEDMKTRYNNEIVTLIIELVSQRLFKVSAKVATTTMAHVA